jgi:NADH-quinone oxidoreductase subunit A
MSKIIIMLIFLLAGPVFVAFNCWLNRLLRPPDRKKQNCGLPYECGQAPANASDFVQFDNHFYVFAVLFVLFSVETVFFLPLVMALRINTWLALFEMVLFTGVFGLGILYVWKKGLLRWD